MINHSFLANLSSKADFTLRSRFYSSKSRIGTITLSLICILFFFDFSWNYLKVYTSSLSFSFPTFELPGYNDYRSGGKERAESLSFFFFGDLDAGRTKDDTFLDPFYRYRLSSLFFISKCLAR